MKLNSEARVALKTAVLTSLLTLILLMGVNYIFNHNFNLFGNSSKNQPFTVQGSATLKASPDQAQIFFGVNKTAKTLDEAQKLANTFMEKMTSDLKQAGINEKDIKTSNYNSYPTYEAVEPVKTMMITRPQSPTITGYTVNESVTITLHDTDKTNTVIDIVTKDGAENVSGPNFSLSEDTQKKLMNDGRLQAIAEAKQKASDMAKAAGIRLGKLVSVQESNTPYPVAYPMMGAGMAYKADSSISAPTRLSPGENEVTVTVTLAYETW